MTLAYLAIEPPKKLTDSDLENIVDMEQKAHVEK